MDGRFKTAKIVITVCALLILGSLIKIQLVDGEAYREQSDRRTTRSIVLEAPRGEIYDRYGRDIVVNRSGYSVHITKQKGMDNQNLNRLINNLCKVFKRGNQPKNAEFPIVYDGEEFKFKMENVYSMQNGDEESAALEKRWKKEHGFSSKASADEVMAALSEKYSLEEYQGTNLAEIAAVRMDMEERSFSYSVPYVFGTDVSIEVVASIKEQSAGFGGVGIVVQPVRDYAEEGVATHILGRVGNISREEYEQNKDKGYGINSMIGKQGLEKYLEKYLRGTDGLSAAEQTTKGSSLESNVEKAAVNGRNVSLTIDFELQKEAERALKENILAISSEAGSAEGGKDCDSGAIVVMDVNNGDVLAMASYPTYNVESFSSDYARLVENPARPLINRALMGTYTPGSTFKPCVAFAGLQEGAIDVDTLIEDTGKYTYYKDYQPGCWLYNQKGETHGNETVSEAIRDSCNIFFFETGRRLGIEKINEYAAKFGFGSKTGIELEDEEKAGSLSSPENRQKRNEKWYPGDVLQTAIGQSDTLVTPLQLASYTSTIANGGIRYRPHLIKSIQAGEDSHEIVIKPEEISRIEMSEENYAAVTKGMEMVVSSGTAQAAFQGCPVSVAAKTGSAQMGSIYTNGVYIAYAPCENPQIAVACVLEKAGGGSKAAPIVRAVIEKYFSNDGAEESCKANTLLP